MLSIVARDFAATTVKTRFIAARPENVPLSHSAFQGVATPLSPIRLGFPPEEPRMQWEPAPLSKYGLAVEEAVHPRVATLVVDGVSPKASQSCSASESLASSSSTLQFAVKQRNTGVDVWSEPSALTTSAEILRQMAPAKPQAPRTGATLSRTSRLTNRGRWNAHAQNLTGPGSHAVHMLAATKRGRTLRSDRGVESAVWVAPSTRWDATSSPRLPPLERPHKNVVAHTS